MAVRLPVLIRQTKVFELVIAGKTYDQIQKELGCSEDTIARDMQAIGEQVQAIAKERLGEAVAVALANYQAIIDEAWRNYRADNRRITDWYDGRLNYEVTIIAKKSLGVAGGANLDDPDDSDEGAQESAPVEVKRTRRTVRPPLINERVAWMQLAMQATREFTELLGIKKLIIELGGPKGGPIVWTGPALDQAAQELSEWRKQRMSELSSLPSAAPAPTTSATPTES